MILDEDLPPNYSVTDIECYHFVWEHIVDEFIKVVFVKSVENDANLFTKKVSKDAYTKHISNFLGKKENLNG
jgi:hypothetical protein